MFYLIQDNLFREEGFKELVHTLDRLELGYEVIKFIPFVQELEFTTMRKDVFFWGSVNMSKIAHKYNFYPGSMYNENHDFEVYALHYGDNMLNWDGQTMHFMENVPLEDYMFFARPTKDTKVFSGQVFTQDSWKEYVQGVIENDAIKSITSETRILVAPLKETWQEVRCWIVDGKVITASRYRLGRHVKYQNYDDETLYVDFAQKMADIYQPAKAFVMDVCLYNDELKIVEINCINCSGFYQGRMGKVIYALEETFKTTNV